MRQIVRDYRKKVSGRFRGKFGQYPRQDFQQRSAARIWRGFPGGIARKIGETRRVILRCRGNAALPSVSRTVALYREAGKGLIILENRDDDQVAAYPLGKREAAPDSAETPPDA